MSLLVSDILKREPWHIAYVNIGQRCNNKNHPKYKFYGGRGIKRTISATELREMYARDKAHLMKSPSVDRIDASKDYSKDNCRYIEMDENRKLANDQRTARIKERKERLNIEKLRDLVCKFNRMQPNSPSEVTSRDIENIFSPPFKGFERRTKEYPYPPQIIGIHSDKKNQKNRVSGSTSGQSQFGGVSGSSYGIATGGSHST